MKLGELIRNYNPPICYDSFISIGKIDGELYSKDTEKVTKNQLVESKIYEELQEKEVWTFSAVACRDSSTILVITVL